MYTHLYVKTHYSYNMLTKLEFPPHIFQKSSDIKFNENPSSGSRVVPCGRTDRHHEALFVCVFVWTPLRIVLLQLLFSVKFFCLTGLVDEIFSLVSFFFDVIYTADKFRRNLHVTENIYPSLQTIAVHIPTVCVLQSVEAASYGISRPASSAPSAMFRSTRQGLSTASGERNEQVRICECRSLLTLHFLSPSFC
jgi:hypothetical protein